MHDYYILLLVNVQSPLANEIKNTTKQLENIAMIVPDDRLDTGT
jgi:hypothetical protein